MYRYARGARFYDGPDEVHRETRRAADPARLRAARGRRAERARPDAARGVAAEVRRRARSRDGERLSGACGAPAMAGDPDDRDGRGRLPVRLLVIVLVAQLVVAGGRRSSSPSTAGRSSAAPPRPSRGAPPRRARAIPRRRRATVPDAARRPLRRRARRSRSRAARCALRAAARGLARRCGGWRAICGRGCPRGRLEPVPGHPGLRNVVGSDRRAAGRRSSLVAHYDTVDAPPGFVGANDGAAGDGGARRHRRRAAAGAAPARRPRGAVRAVRRGGGAGLRPKDFLASGAARLAGVRAPRTGRTVARDDRCSTTSATAACGSRARARRDAALWTRLRAAAAAVGVGGGRSRRARAAAIFDDHTPFLDARDPGDRPDRLRLPVLVHVHEDTLDKLSARSLDVTRRDGPRAAAARAPR